MTRGGDGGGTKFRRESEGLFSFLGTRSHVHCSPELKSMPSWAYSRFSRRSPRTGTDQPMNAFAFAGKRDYKDYA